MIDQICNAYQLADGTWQPEPSADQPGTLGQQLATIDVALYLAARRGSDAARESNDARRLVLPHAAGRETGVRS